MTRGATLRWFGESWGAPVCDPEQHVETPVGMVCIGHDHLHSDRSAFIVAGDQGVTMPYVRRTAPLVWVAFHLECWLHEVGAS